MIGARCSDVAYPLSNKNSDGPIEHGVPVVFFIMNLLG